MYYSRTGFTPVKQQRPTYTIYTPITYQRLDFGKEQIKQQENYNNPNSMIKANILNNRTMVFTNYSQIDFAIVFEEQLKIINQSQDYIQRLKAIRSELPSVKKSMDLLYELRSDILQVQCTVKKQVYQEEIKTKTQIMILKSVALQKQLASLSNFEKLPYNPYCQDSKALEFDETEFNALFHRINGELNNYESIITLTITKLKYQQAEQEMLCDSDQININEQDLLVKKSEISDYLTLKLSQSLNKLIEIHKDDTYNLSTNVYQQLNTQIVYFYEKLTIVEGHLSKLEQIYISISKLRQKLDELKITYHDFEDFYKEIQQIYKQVKNLKKQVKTISLMTNEPVLQALQMKYKNKNLKAVTEIWKEINHLFEQGALIKQIKVEEKQSFYQSLQISEQIESLKKIFDEFEIKFTSKQYSVPFSEAKRISNLLNNLEITYSKSDSIRQELHQLFDKIIFTGYKSYIKDVLIPQFTVPLQQLAIKKNKLLQQKFKNPEVLLKIKSIFQFTFPKFQWKEPLDLELERILSVYERSNWVKECLSNFQIEQMSNEYKFMKQLTQLDQELDKSLVILEKYFAIKEKIGGNRIDLICWPKQEKLMIIQERSKYCLALAEETNQIIETIEQLNELNLLSQIKLIFQSNPQTINQDLNDLAVKLNNIVFSATIKPQIKIVLQFVNHCLQYCDIDLDHCFCTTTTYKELEELFGGLTHLLKIKDIQEHNKEDQELRHIMFELTNEFIKQKVSQDFSNLFQFKVIQSQGGVSDYDPQKLCLRTDLLYPIQRNDMQSNPYCLHEIEKIGQIIDQPQLRILFELFRDLMQQSTQILNSDSNNNSDDQLLILQLISEFEEKMTLKTALTDLSPMHQFHQHLSEWPRFNQIENHLIQLGIVLQKEYTEYLKACRKRIIKLSGVSETLIVDSLNENAIQSSLKFIHEGQEFSFYECFQQYIYRDVQSIIIQHQQLTLTVETTLNIYYNGQQLQNYKEFVI